MKYVMIQDSNNPDIQMYYVMDDTMSNVIKVIDLNCNECSPPAEHFIVDKNPPLPFCAEQQP
jgi:hypothetical protein